MKSQVPDRSVSVPLNFSDYERLDAMAHFPVDRRMYTRARDGTWSEPLTRDPTRPDPDAFDPVTRPCH